MKNKSFKSEIDRIFLLQKENRWKIANTDSSIRIKKLKKLKEAILKYKKELREALFLDFHKSPSEVDLTEILPTIAELDDACDNLKNWMKPVNVKTPLSLYPSKSQIIYEPKGQVLIFGPWNYPFQLIAAPLIASIAAGNCSILKPSELTPNTSALIQKLIREIFPEEEVAVFEGQLEIANYLLEKPFDHIFFTGSPAVGSIVMKAAAQHLTSVTLELGGKSPLIVDKTADLDSSVDKIVWGKILNGGQTCIGVDYILVQESKHDELIQKLKSTLKEFYGQDPENWKNSPDLCRIINQKNFLRIKNLVKNSVKKGAVVEIGGEFVEKDKYIAPTILSSVQLDQPIMQEEIFGPVLPILKYKHIDDAIKIIQSKEKPLALYIFSKDKKQIQYILSNTSSGGVLINGVLVHLGNPYLPFGGVNHSGIGSYHGIFGFKAFSHERAVMKLSKINLLKNIFPPYSAKTEKFIELITKYL